MPSPPGASRRSRASCSHSDSKGNSSAPLMCQGMSPQAVTSFSRQSQNGGTEIIFISQRRKQRFIELDNLSRVKQPESALESEPRPVHTQQCRSYFHNRLAHLWSSLQWRFLRMFRSPLFHFTVTTTIGRRHQCPCFTNKHDVI